MRSIAATIALKMSIDDYLTRGDHSISVKHYGHRQGVGKTLENVKKVNRSLGHIKRSRRMIIT